MKHHIIVGHDGGAGGADALALAVTLVDSWYPGAQVTVAAIYPYDPAYRSASTTFEQDLRDQTEAQLTAARERYADRQDVEFVLRRGSSPAQALHDLAHELDAQIIVVGRSHTKALGRTFLGSVTEQTLHGAPCTVGVAPVGYADRAAPLATVGVAYDGAPDARSAVQVAADLARSAGTSLHVIRVLEPIALWYGGTIDPYPLVELQQAAEVDLSGLRDDLDGVQVETTMLTGEAASALATVEGVDLLVVGSRGFGPVRRVVLGSTSTRLVRQTELPLLVVVRVEDPAETPAD